MKYIKKEIIKTFNFNSYYYLNNYLIDLIKIEMNNKYLNNYYKNNIENELKINFYLNNNHKNYYYNKLKTYEKLIKNYIEILEIRKNYKKYYDLYFTITNKKLKFNYKDHYDIYYNDLNLFNEIKNNYSYDNIIKNLNECLRKCNKKNIEYLFLLENELKSNNENIYNNLCFIYECLNNYLKIIE